MNTNPSKTFADLGISPWLVETLSSLSITSPSEIQTQCIPEILNGKNVIGSARTGSGKTAAFALPIIESLALNMTGMFALILSPTRELAVQIGDQFRILGTGVHLRELVIVGGMDQMAQAQQLQNLPHIIIATPGRLADILRTSPQKPNLQLIKFLVMDEADRLLHHTFSDDLETIFSYLPRKRQTLLFSATITKSIETLYTSSEDQSNMFVYASTKIPSLSPQLDQRYLFIANVVKDAYLVYLMRNAFQDMSVVIFTSRCRTCALILTLLQNFGIRSTGMHSFMTQSERMASLAKFKSNLIRILVTTDVGSRGLDIPQARLVLNYDIPACATDYVHRVGRTARAGRGGLALSFVGQHDIDVVLNIEKQVGCELVEFDQVSEAQVVELQFLNEVNIAKREALLHLEKTGFGTKQDINTKKKQKKKAVEVNQ